MPTTKTKAVPNAELLTHEPFCQPQPGEAAPRVESFRLFEVNRARLGPVLT